jgi:hypothetical protein
MLGETEIGREIHPEFSGEQNIHSFEWNFAKQSKIFAEASVWCGFDLDVQSVDCERSSDQNQRMAVVLR